MASSEGEFEYLGLQSPGTETKGIEGATLASSASVALAFTHYIHQVSGTAAQVLAALPYPGFAGTIAVIPTGVFTWTTAATGATAVNRGFGLAGTAVVGKTLFFTYSRAAGLWYPSYVA